MIVFPDDFPLAIPCHRCKAVVMGSGTAADLVALVEEKNDLVREVERLREALRNVNIERVAGVV